LTFYLSSPKTILFLGYSKVTPYTKFEHSVGVGNNYNNEHGYLTFCAVIRIMRHQ